MWLLLVLAGPSAVVTRRMTALQRGEGTATETEQPIVRCSRWEQVAALSLSQDRHRVRVRVFPAGSSIAAFAVVAPSLLFDFSLVKDEEWVINDVRCLSTFLRVVRQRRR